MYFILESWGNISEWATLVFENIVTFKTNKGSSSVNHLKDFLLDEISVVACSDILLGVEFATWVILSLQFTIAFSRREIPSDIDLPIQDYVHELICFLSFIN